MISRARVHARARKARTIRSLLMSERFPVLEKALFIELAWQRLA